MLACLPNFCYKTLRGNDIRTLLFCVFAVHALLVCAQVPTYTWQDFVEEMASDEYAEQEAWTETMEELAMLAAHPMDINTATREQMQKLPFLNDRQIEDIQTYIFTHGGMRSMSELMAVSSIDFRTRQFLSLFFTAKVWPSQRQYSVNLKTLLRDAKHEVSTRMDIPLYYRLGYSYTPENGGYKGSPLYHNLRYQLENRRHLSLGVTAEKDQGEPFRENGGWDHYGAYLAVHDIGHLRMAVAGDYKMGFGEGLVVNTGFSTGKTSLMKRPSQGIRAKRGMDEVNYLRGGAATIGLGKVNLTAWLSYRRLDASVNDDGTVKTLQTSGLHRTVTELDQKRQVGSAMAGGNLTWKNKGFHVGTTGYYQWFQKSLEPGDALYRQIYPRGQDFGVVGVNYGYTHLWFSVAGETAYSTEQGGWATLERVSWRISPRYTLSGSYRFYSYHYYSFYASALSENSDVQNESGATLRLDAQPADRLTLSAYADFFYNPWPRYTLTHSSSGQELNLRTEYQLDRRNRLSLRYQLKRKERNDRMQLHNRIQLQYTRQQGQYWQLQSVFNMHAMDQSGTGWSVGQRVRFQKNAGQCSALLTYFNTPDYDTRIFQYEPLLTNTFRYPSLFGRGLRFVAAGRYAFWKKRLMAEVLYGLTRYTDREKQGSGMQEIRSPWKQDISVQLRLRLK